ncbi:MAG: hypothetical protein ACRDE2_09140, partial [Chitinophagaceae bacterium]
TKEFPLPGTVTEDTVYYSSFRKLTWADFTGTKTPGSFSAAETLPGFSYNAIVIQKKDTVFIHVFLETYFVRNESWVEPGAENDYALSHEQIHFDIAKIAEKQFGDSLKKRVFSPEYYPIEIHFLYWDIWRKMTGWELRFDEDTQHGMDRAAEADWAKKVRKALLSGSGLN